MQLCSREPEAGKGADEDILTVFYWQEEPDYEDAWWWEDDYEPSEEP